MVHILPLFQKKILNDILRDELHYKGVIITDAMNMMAVSRFKNFNQNEICKLAINAGADILCMPVIMRNENDIEKLKNLYDYLNEEVKKDANLKQRIDESVTRILNLKDKIKN